MQSALNRVSMKVTADLSLNYPDSRPKKQRAEYLIRRDGGRLDIMGRYQFIDKLQDKSYRERTVFEQGRFLNYQCSLATKIPDAGSVSKKNATEYFAKYNESIALGGPLDGIIFAMGGRRIADNLLDANDLHIRGREVIKDIPCLVVEGHTRYGEARLWIAPSVGYSCLKYILDRSGNDLWDGDKPLSQQPPLSYTEDPRVDPPRPVLRILSVLDEVRVEKIDGHFVPVEGRFVQSISRYQGSKIEDRAVYRRTEIHFDPDFSGTDAFRIDLPEGLIVFFEDNKQSGIVYKWSNGDVVPAFRVYQGDRDKFVAGRMSNTTLVLGIIALNVGDAATRPVLLEA